MSANPLRCASAAGIRPERHPDQVPDTADLDMHLINSKKLAKALNQFTDVTTKHSKNNQGYNQEIDTSLDQVYEALKEEIKDYQGYSSPIKMNKTGQKKEIRKYYPWFSREIEKLRQKLIKLKRKKNKKGLNSKEEEDFKKLIQEYDKKIKKNEKNIALKIKKK